MKKELFVELLSSMNEAAEHARGKRDLRTTILPVAPAALGARDIRALRERLNASQAVFAHCLNVSTQLVQAWEAARRKPEGAALRLLDIGRHNPEVVFPVLVSPGTPVVNRSPIRSPKGSSRHQKRRSPKRSAGKVRASSAR